MIDSVPLIQNANDAQQINASIIAMKKASRELDEKIVKLNSLNSELDKKIALLDSGLNKEIEDRKEAINSLDVPSVGGSGKYISAISETDGKISATTGDITSSVSSGNSQPVTSGGVATAISQITETNIIYDGTITDCNNAWQKEKTVTYWLANNIANNPNTNHTWYILSQCNPSVVSSNAYITQIATSSDSGNYNEVYTRHAYLSGGARVWTPWRRLIKDTDVVDIVENNNMNPITSNAVYRESLNKLSFFSGADFTKPDNYGRPSYLLIADCTAWWGASAGATPKGMTGIIASGIRLGFIHTHDLFEIVFGISYGRNSGSIGSVYTSFISSVRNTGTITPVFLKNGNTYYMALKVIGSGTNYYFWGTRQGIIALTQWINTTDSSGTLPSGWEIVTP